MKGKKKKEKKKRRHWKLKVMGKLGPLSLVEKAELV
jgi:hypothetical protein